MNPERSYCGDIENSLVRVRDHTCHTLRFIAQSLFVSYHPGSSGAAFSGTPYAVLEPFGMPNKALGPTMLMDWKMKYSLKIDGFDVDGNPAYDLLVILDGPAADWWQDALIYMVMTDRFVNGNTSNDEPMVGAAQGQIGRVVTLRVL